MCWLFRDLCLTFENELSKIPFHYSTIPVVYSTVYTLPSSSLMCNCSQFGVFPESIPGKWRLIVDLFSPEGKSVTDRVSIPRCSLAYVCVEGAVQGVAAISRGSLMAKVDIRQVYRGLYQYTQQTVVCLVWCGTAALLLGPDQPSRCSHEWQMP